MPACSPSDCSVSVHLVAVRLGPAHVHAQQHLGPVLRLGAAGAGVHLDVAVVGVGLAGQQALDLAPLGLGGERLEVGDGGIGGARRRPRPRPVRSVRARRRRRCSSLLHALDLVGEPAALAHHAAGLRRHRSRASGSSARAFSSSRRRTAASQSKMPPQQGHRCGDLLVQGFGFGAHGTRGIARNLPRRHCAGGAWRFRPRGGPSTLPGTP